MTRDELRARDLTRLTGVRPELAAKVAQLLEVMDMLGFPMTVTDGLRTTAQQQALYAQGRQKQADGTWLKLPDARAVTNADGVTHRSKHQDGRAVDCTFLDPNNQPTWDGALPWAAYGANAEALGLTWGGAWSSLRDLPHVEL